MKIEYPAYLVNGKLMNDLRATVIPVKIATVVESAKNKLSTAQQMATHEFIKNDKKEGGVDAFVQAHLALLDSANEKIRAQNRANIFVVLGLKSPKKEIQYSILEETQKAKNKFEAQRMEYISRFMDYFLNRDNLSRLTNFTRLKFNDPNDIMYVTLEDYHLLGLESD